MFGYGNMTCNLFIQTLCWMLQAGHKDELMFLSSYTMLSDIVAFVRAHVFSL